MVHCLVSVKEKASDVIGTLLKVQEVLDIFKMGVSRGTRVARPGCCLGAL